MAYRKKFISLDLETTHLDMEEGKIMEIGAIEVELSFAGEKGPLKVVFGKKFNTLVNPEIEPSPTALALTGIKAEDLKSAPKWKDVKTELSEFLGDGVILGHNISFDLGYLIHQGMKLKNRSVDSLELALTVLPFSSSHSLEFLGEKYEVLKKAPHRALVDSENCAEVLPELLNEFLSYSLDLQRQIKEVLKKSNVGFADLILDLPEMVIKKFDLSRPSATLPTPGEGGKVEISFEDKTIFCLPLSLSLNQEIVSHLAKRKERAIVGLSHPVYLEALPQDQKLAGPTKALCPIRYARLLESPKFPAILARIFIKIMIFRSLRQSFDLSEVKWAWEEAPVLQLTIADSDVCKHHDCGYEKYLQSGRRVVRFGDLKSIFRLAADWEVDFSADKLLLFDLASIEDHYSEAVQQTFNLRQIRAAFSFLYSLEKNTFSINQKIPKEIEEILNELDLFFGILHLVYLKREGEFSQNLLIDEQEREGERFGKLFHPAEKLISKLGKAGMFLTEQAELADSETRLEFLALAKKLETVSGFINQFFISADPQQICWLRFNHAWVDLNIQPVSLENSWREFMKKFQSITIADTQLPSAAYRYYQNRLGLSDFKSEKCSPDAQLTPIPVKIFSKNGTAKQQVSWLKDLAGRTLVIVPNENTLEDFYQQLQKERPEVLAYKFSGRAAQIRQKLERAGDNAMLILTTHSLGRDWRRFPAMDNLVIVRLPFEALGAKSSSLGLSRDSGFREYVLPRAINQLHLMLCKFVSQDLSKQQIFILDPRVLAEYDRAFMNYLEEFPDFQVSTIDKA